MAGKKGLRLKKIIEKKEMLTAGQFAVRRLIGLLIRVMIETFAVCGALASSAMALEVEFDLPLFVIFCTAICLGMEVLSHFQKKWKFLYLVAGAGFFCVVLLLHSLLLDALYSICNTISAHFCTYYGKAFVSIGGDAQADTLGRTLVLAAFAVILDILVLYIVKENGHRVWYLLVTLLVVLFPYLVGLPVQGVGIIFYTGATVALVCGHVVRHVNGKRVRTRNLTEYFIQGTILLVFLLIGVVIPLVFTQEDYEEKFDAKGIKKNIQETMKGFENGMFDFFGGKDSSASYAGGLNKGKLGWVDQVNYTQEEALSVELPEQMQRLSNKTLYLRGYIGDVYTAGQMENLERVSRQSYDDLERDLDTDLSDITEKFFDSGILDQEVAEAFEMAAPKGTEGENICQLLLKNKEGQLSREESQKDILVKNVWTTGDEYFLPYFTQKAMKRGHDGSLWPGEETEVSEEDGVAYRMPVYYPVYSGLYQALFRSDGKEGEQFGIGVIQEAFVLEEAIEGYTGKTLEEYLEQPEAEADEQVSVASLLLSAGNRLSVSQLKKDPQISLWKLAGTVKNIKDFGVLENKYRQWVYSTYLTLPKGSSEKMFDVMKKQSVSRKFKSKEGAKYRSLEEIGGVPREDITRAVRTVRKYISKDTEYNLSPGSLPEGKDFVKYFLEEKKMGYCIHYAAAGMLALRAMGVPARYVEGFVIADENYETAVENPDGTITVSLKDMNAHAWVEIYLDGFGWFPVEMTPGYYAETEAENQAEDKNLNKDEEQGQEAAEDESEMEDEMEDESEEDNLDGKENLEESAPPTIPPEMREWAEQEYGDQLAEDEINVMLDEEKKNEEISSWVVLLLSILGGILLLMLIIFIQQKYVYGKRKKAFQHKSRNYRIISAYLTMEKLLKQKGGKEGTSFLEKEFREMEGFAIQAYFSGQEMSEEEWKEVFALYKKMRQDCYKKAGLGKKISYRLRGF